MELELVEWKKTVKLARKEFYDLNYYTTVQLLTLRRELSTEKRDYSAISPSVLFLLHSISRNVDSRGVCELVKNVLASTASNPFTSKPIVQPENKHAVLTPQLKTKELVGDDSSKDNTMHSDMPELTENELTDEKREILEFVTRCLDCSKYLVLKAFEECQGKDMDKYDVRKWCFDNLEEYDFEEEVGSDSGEEEEDQEEEPMSLDDSDSEAQRMLTGLAGIAV